MYNISFIAINIRKTIHINILRLFSLIAGSSIVSPSTELLDSDRELLSSCLHCATVPHSTTRSIPGIAGLSTLQTLQPCYAVMDPIDPLRSIEKEESEDLFKSAFKGTAGVIKITSDSDSQPG